MHSQIYYCQGDDENFDIRFPAGEDLHLALENVPNHGERVLTIGADALAPPLLEISSGEDFVVGALELEAIPEGRVCMFNLWQRDGQTLDLMAEGRFVRRATIAPSFPTAPFAASALGPVLLFDGDSVMQNMPGTRIFLEQKLGHKFRFPEGYQNATGGDSAQKVYFGTPEVAARIEPNNTVVLVGPIGANQTSADDSFEEITGYIEQVFDDYLAAGAIVVAVPTLLDGIGITNQDAKKTALADWVSAYAAGGTISFAGTDYAVAPHEGFHAVDVSAFDRNLMKSDVSHPNALGAEYLAGQLAEVLEPLVSGTVHAAVEAGNFLLGAEKFQGSRNAETLGTTGVAPAGWGMARAEGSGSWIGSYDSNGYFQVSVSDTPDDGTCILTYSEAEVSAEAGDVVAFAADIETLQGSSGLKSFGLLAQGQTPMTLDPDWAVSAGTYHLRTADKRYENAQPLQTMQIYIRVAAGASVTITFHQASAFFVENTGGLPRLSGTPDSEGTVGEYYSFAPVLEGGTAPFVFDLAGGALPTGLSLNNVTGAISGTPSVAGFLPGISLRVTDANAATSIFPYFSIDIQNEEPTETITAVWDATINTAIPEQLVYSSADTVVSATTSINGLRHARGDNVLSGKRYFELGLGPQVLGVGISTSNVTATLGGSFGTDRCFWSGGFLFHTGGNNNMGGSLASGDVVQVALDVDAKQIWMRRNGSGDWNNVTGADPSIGSGGVDCSGLSGELYAYAGLQNDASASVVLSGSTDEVTFAAPTGFSAIV